MMRKQETFFCFDESYLAQSPLSTVTNSNCVLKTLNVMFDRLYLGYRDTATNYGK